MKITARKCPSQDDIDRISKVTASAPISIDEQKGSLGRKTIESLKEIELKRHLHLTQQGLYFLETLLINFFCCVWLFCLFFKLPSCRITSNRAGETAGASTEGKSPARG